MITVQIVLPDVLAQEAAVAGLLAPRFLARGRGRVIMVGQTSRGTPRQRCIVTGVWNSGLADRRSAMSALLDELSKRAKELAVEERARLAQELMESVNQESDPEIEATWESEIASRVAKYERGEAKLIPASEVLEAARRLTQRRRPSAMTGVAT